MKVFSIKLGVNSVVLLTKGSNVRFVKYRGNFLLSNVGVSVEAGCQKVLSRYGEE